MGNSVAEIHRLQMDKVGIMLRISGITVLALFISGSAYAQTAPETLAYLLFGVSSPSRQNSDSDRIDFPQSTPTIFQFVRHYLGKNKEITGKDNDITIEQTSPCNFRLTGQYRWGNNLVMMDNTLDFTNLSGADPQVVSQTMGRVPSTYYYMRLDGIKACTRKGSFRDENRYYQFPDKNQCEDFIYSSLLLRDEDFQRTLKAYSYFKQTYCKGRAF